MFYWNKLRDGMNNLDAFIINVLYISGFSEFIIFILLVYLSGTMQKGIVNRLQ